MKNIFGLLLVAGLAVPAFADQPATVSRDDVRAMVSEMMADAETRSSLLQGGATAGYDRNFFLASADNKYRLNISGYSQVRYTANIAGSDNTFNTGLNNAGPTTGNPPVGTQSDGSGEDYKGGFNIRRAAIGFNGNAGSESLKYTVSIISEDGGSMVLNDGFVAYEMGGGWAIKAGQYKMGFLKEDLNSDVYIMALDRGFVNNFFGQGRSQGASMYYLSDQFDASVDFTDGIRGKNRSTFGANSDTTSTDLLAADYSFAGRGEYRFAGTRAQLKDYTSRQDEKYAGNIGFAALYQTTANNNNTSQVSDGATPPVFTPAYGSDASILGYTVDAQVEGGGFGAFIALVGAHTKVSSVTAQEVTYDDFGVVIQGNYRVLADTELFAKYELLALDGDRANPAVGAVTPDFQRYTNFITTGVNQYFAGNAAKLSADVVVGLNHTNSAASQTLTGNSTTSTFNGNALGVTGTNKGAEVALRVQFQVMF